MLRCFVCILQFEMPAPITSSSTHHTASQWPTNLDKVLTPLRELGFLFNTLLMDQIWI